MNIIDEKFRYEWLKEEKIKIEKKKKRRYLHFDARIKTIGKKIAKDVFDPDYIVRRFFYPFVRYTKKERKYKEDKFGKRYVSEKKKPRVIQYASHKDAIIYSWYSYILSNLYEKQIKTNGVENNVIAYRRIDGKNNIDFSKEVFNYIKNKKDCVAICFDIEGFFDNLEHSRVKMVWKNLLDIGGLLISRSLPEDHYKIYKSITQYKYCDKKELSDLFGINKNNFNDFPTFCSLDDFKKLVRGKIIKTYSEKKGIPQGTSLSVLLSNAYMFDFDVAISGFIKNKGGIYRRYSDDIIVVCDSNNYKEIISLVNTEIKKISLNIQKEKTEIRLFNKKGNKIKCTNEKGNLDKLQYLGIETDGNFESLRGKTIAKFYRRMTWAVNTQKRRQKKRPSTKVSKRNVYKRFLHDRPLSFFSYFNDALSKLDSDNLEKMFKKNKLVKSIRKRIEK